MRTPPFLELIQCSLLQTQNNKNYLDNWPGWVLAKSCSLKQIYLWTLLLQDLHAAMKMLGLNPMEQEVIDLTNNIVKRGHIYFPEFCKVIHEKYREDDEELFMQNMFKVEDE